MMDKTESQYRAEWILLAALMLVQAAIFAIFYPPMSGIEDEVGFINQSMVWMRGAISAEGAGYSPQLADFFEIGGRHVATRQPGRSLTILPFLAIGGMRSIYWSGLLLHLGAVVFAAKLLRKIGGSPLGAVLVLFHPTLTLYSRTITADGAAGLGLLLAVWSVVRVEKSSRAAWQAGLAVGFAALMRAHAALALPFIVFAVYRHSPQSQRLKNAMLCVIAGLAVGGAIAIYNAVVYRSLVEPFSAQRGYFSATFVGPHAMFYGAALLLIWPGMLVAPILAKSRVRYLTISLCALFLVPLLFYYFHDRSSNYVETLVIGQRLLQIILPLWIVSYAYVIDEAVIGRIKLRSNSKATTILVAGVIIALLVATAYGFHKHQKHLQSLVGAREAIVANVPANATLVCHGGIYKLVGVPEFSPEYHRVWLDFEGEPEDYEVQLHKQFEALNDDDWGLAIFEKQGGAELSPRAARLISKFALVEIATESSNLRLFRHERPK